MLKPTRLAAWLVLLATLLLAFVLLGGRDHVVSARLAPPRDHIVNRIAFVGLDGLIRSVRPNGSGVREISPKDGYYTWPTWSPDARRLVFSGVISDGPRSQEINIYSYTRYNGLVRDIYRGERGVAGLLAQGVVHYPLWSPDSRHVAFIAVTGQGLTLFLDDLSDDPDSDFILAQGPLWMSWSHDSKYLLIHRGANHFLLDTSGRLQPEVLDFETSRYRVPAWKPREDIVTVMLEKAPEEYAIYTSDVGSTQPTPTRELATVESDPAFLCSPTGDFLAVAGTPLGLNLLGVSMLVYQDLTLVSDDESRDPLVIKENVLAFFWSPNGRKLAYVTLSNTRGVLTWKLLDLNTRTERRLIDFVPSRDQLTMFSSSTSTPTPTHSGLRTAGRWSSRVPRQRRPRTPRSARTPATRTLTSWFSTLAGARRSSTLPTASWVSGHPVNRGRALRQAIRGVGPCGRSAAEDSGPFLVEVSETPKIFLRK